MHVIDLIKRAREFVEKGWTQGVHARDADDQEVHPLASTACKWCANGALVAAVCEMLPDDRDERHGRLKACQRALLQELHETRFHFLVTWNDSAETKHSQVLDLFDKTIKRLEGVECTEVKN